MYSNVCIVFEKYLVNFPLERNMHIHILSAQCNSVKKDKYFINIQPQFFFQPHNYNFILEIYLVQNKICYIAQLFANDIHLIRK